jgi:hypothetical protein
MTSPIPMPDDKSRFSLPADFAEHGQRIRAELCTRYGVSKNVIDRWRRESGVKGIPETKKPIPDDFVAMSRTMTRDDICKHYGVGLSALERWRRESGLIGKRAPRPDRLSVPDDFKTVAVGKTQDQLMAHYGVSKPTIYRWQKEAGVSPFKIHKGGPPANFPEVAATRNQCALAALYRVTRQTIARWIWETNAPRPNGVLAPAPDDFRAMCKVMNLTGLTVHYDRDIKVIHRWCRETGTQAANLSAKRPVEPRPKTVRRIEYRGPKLPSAPMVASGREEEAAQFLRRFYIGVYRSTERGSANPKGKHWRCGNAVLTPEEMVERAEAKGFDPRAWTRIAA